MKTLKETLDFNPFRQKEHDILRDEVLARFADTVDTEMNPDWIMVLGRFCTSPFHYYNEKAISNLSAFFQTNKQLVLESLESLGLTITHATLSMFRKGSSSNNEDSLKLDIPKDIIEFESVWHPEYQRYCEHIFNHLINVPLFVLGKNNKKDYLSLTLSKRVETLDNLGYGFIVSGFNSIIRNSISHGNSFFNEHIGITYADKKRKLELTGLEFSKKFDTLVDECHSIMLSIIIFVCNNSEDVIAFGLDKLPLGIRMLFISSFIDHRGFSILSMVESKSLKSDKQLNVYCISKTKHRSLNLINCLAIARNAIAFGGNAYTRIGLYIDIELKDALGQSVFINPVKLKMAINNNLTIEDSRDVIETSLLWQDASWFERWKNKYQRMFYLISLHFRKQYKLELSKQGIILLRNQYFIKHIENRSSDKTGRILAHVILKGPLTLNIQVDSNKVTKCEEIESIVTHVIKKLKKKRFKPDQFTNQKLLQFRKKPRYIWLRLYKQDKRLRNLKISGWNENNLIAEVEWISKLKGDIIYVKTPDYRKGRYLFKYRPSLTEEVMQEVKDNGKNK